MKRIQHSKFATHWGKGTAGLALLGALSIAPAQAQPGASLAAYRCDENGGAQVQDTSGNDNHGTSTGVTYSPDVPFVAPDNFALEFNHGQDAVTIPAGPTTNLNSYTALTLEAHIKPTTTSGLHFILWADDGPFTLFINNNVLSFGLVGSSGSVTRSAAFTAAGAWAHVAGTWDGTTATLYVNGAPVSSGAAAVGTVTVSPVRNIIRIGNDETADFAGFNRDLRGLIDEVRIVDRALSPAEVLFDATHSFSAPSAELRCSAISAGAAAGVGGGFIVNAGQVVIGRSVGAGRAVHAGLLPCLSSGLPVSGDCDFDGDLDYEDMDKFASCATGPDAGPVSPECDCSDLDGDTDADLLDWAEFQVSFTGP